MVNFHDTVSGGRLRHRMKRGLSHTIGGEAPFDQFDWDRLRVFRAVAKTGSMSAAAIVLGGSLPTISRRVTDLETALQAELFQRNHTGVDLTDAGRTLLRHADLMADTIHAAQIEVGSVANDVGRAIHLVCNEPLAQYWIVPRLAEFQLLNPELTIDVSISNSSLESQDSAWDISIQTYRPRNPDQISRRIGRSHFAAFVSSDWKLSNGTPASVSDLTQAHALVHASYASQLEQSRTLFPGLDMMRRMNSMEAMISFCSAGVSPAILPTHIIHRYPDVIACPIPGLPALDIWLTQSPRLRRVKSADGFLDWLVGLFSPTESDWFRQLNVTLNLG